MSVRAALLALVAATPAYGQDHAVGDRFDDPMQIAREAVSAYAIEEEGYPGTAVDISMSRDGRITILVAHTGFADDSVNGERTQYALEHGDDGMWAVIYTRVD